LVATTFAAAEASEPIPWQRAVEHVGRRIVVEGVVVATRSIDAGCVLAFSDAEPPPFTVTLVTPLLTRGPARPAEHYLGKRVRVTGVVRRLAGHAPEIVVRNPGEISVMEPAGPAAPLSAGKPPVTEAATGESTTTTQAPVRAAVAAPTTGSDERDIPSVAPVPGPPVLAGCTAARARWRHAGTRIENVLDSLSVCVRGERYRCRHETEAVYGAMAELAAAEGAIEASCP
jgi:hypothetical protein